MPVQTTMRCYRTTETEKALGRTSKHVLVGYLKSVREVLSQEELLLTETEKQKEKQKARDTAKIRAWEAEYKKLMSKILRAELSSSSQNALGVPLPPSALYTNPYADKHRFLVTVRSKVHQKEIERLMKRQPSEEAYQTAEMSFRREFPYTVSSKTLGTWTSKIDTLIADLETRNSPDVYTAQIMAIRQNVEDLLYRYGITPEVKKTVVREAKARKK